jgi:ABC-type sugar transport system permease subunit
MRKIASVLAVVVGILMAVAAVATWLVVYNTLSDQKIVVAEDADCLAGDEVDGPFSAYCQAKVIDKHTKGITGGKTYAELARDDPLRATAMDSAFLQASLFTSVLAFGVAAMAFVVGIVLALLGLAIRAPAPAPTSREGRAPREAAASA